MNRNEETEEYRNDVMMIVCTISHVKLHFHSQIFIIRIKPNVLLVLSPIFVVVICQRERESEQLWSKVRGRFYMSLCYTIFDLMRHYV